MRYCAESRFPSWRFRASSRHARMLWFGAEVHWAKRRDRSVVLKKEKTIASDAKPRRMPRPTSLDDNKRSNTLRSASPPRLRLTEPEATPAAKGQLGHDTPGATTVTQ